MDYRKRQEIYLEETSPIVSQGSNRNGSLSPGSFDKEGPPVNPSPTGNSRELDTITINLTHTR